MTNNWGNNNNTSSIHHRSDNNQHGGIQATTKKQALLQNKRQQQLQQQQAQEPWLFQSLNFQSPLPMLPSIGTTSNGGPHSTSISSPTLSSTPFFLDVESLKSLLPSSSRRYNSGFDSHQHHHKSNNNHVDGKRRYHQQRLQRGGRLEALDQRTERRRRKRGRISGALPMSTRRKFALRLDGVKNRQQKAQERSPKHDGKKKRRSKATSRHYTFHYDSDENRQHNSEMETPITLMEDFDEELRQKTIFAAQLNLTLEEYEALDAAYGKDGSSSSNSDGLMTERYYEVFTRFDVDCSGAISPDELRQLLLSTGEDMDDVELNAVIQQADVDCDGEINFDEFIGLMRARKRLLHVANQMGVTGSGLTSNAMVGSKTTNVTGNSTVPSAFPSASLSLSSPVSSLPPLKLATLQSKKHLQQFNNHFTRATPTCLRPGAQIDLTQLRRELAISEYGIQELNSKVREGLQWVQEHCPVTSIKAQIFCHRWGMEKVHQLFLRVQCQAISRAFQKWKSFLVYERNKIKANMFLKGKGSQKMHAIMTKWKRKVLRRKFVKWTTECRLEARNEIHSAAIEIQRVLRGKLGRLLRYKLQRENAAIQLQAFVRGYLARRLCAQKRRMKLEHEAACLLQRCYRGYNGKRIGRALFKAQKETLAARKIQRAFRNHQRRELLLVIQRTKLENDCAIQLQCCIRRYLARREYNRRATRRRMENSSVVIQRYARGFIIRRQMMKMKKQTAAAVKIQCRYRTYRSQWQVHMIRTHKQQKHQMACERAAAIIVQTKWRCFHSRKLYLIEQSQRLEVQKRENFRQLISAMRIQCVFRGYRARRHAQRLRYEKLKWLNFTVMNQSALKIQVLWRGYHGRLASHLRLQAKKALEYEEHEAARRIQVIARGKLARNERQNLLKKREEMIALQRKQIEAALKIQRILRGKRARKFVAKLQQEHREEAKAALDRLIQQTKDRAATKIQCCIRRFLARSHYLRRQREIDYRRRQEEIRLQREHAAIVIQCAMRRVKARRYLLQRRRDFEKRISMMASEKAHDEIERLRKEQEEELRKLKLQLMHQQSIADENAESLRQELARQQQDEEERRNADAQELAKLRLQAIMQQQSEHRLPEVRKVQEADRLRELFEQEKRAHEEHESSMRTQENEQLAKLKMSTMLQTSSAMKQHEEEAKKLQQEATQLQNAAQALRKDQAKMKIQAFCLKSISKARLLKLKHAQELAMASLNDEEQKLRLKAAQEQELALARLKAMMDDEARAREQEIKLLEMQMLERARIEREAITRRNFAAKKIQAQARGYLGRQRVKAIQQKIEKEREDRAKALELTLAAAEAKVEEAFAADDSTDTGTADMSNPEEWVEYWDENAQAYYYYNIHTQEATWTRPVSAASSKVMDIVLAATAPTVDYDEDAYGNYNAAQIVENGYPVAGNNGETYADAYGYYDQYGQYHYYEATDSNAAALSSYPVASMMGNNMHPGYAAAYAYQAAMASMMYANPMTYGASMMQLPNPMMMQMNAPAPVAVSSIGAPPDPWEKFFDQYTGAAYYYNNLTGERYWA